MAIKLGLLISGNLGYLTLIDLVSKYLVELVMTDKGSTSIIEFSQANNIPVFAGNPRNGRAMDFFKDIEIDILTSVNYLFVIESDLINLPKKVAFNVHGSLLPKYRGRTPHVWAIINNEIETGITAHLIREGCDTGEIIKQIKVPISEKSTGADLLNSYNELYPVFITDVLHSIEEKNFSVYSQDDTKATYFGKRKPEDGLIEWGWQKERINNWVRALAFPYPGAFANTSNGKLIIDEITYDQMGFDAGMPNGLVLGIDPIRIKTPNGVVVLSKIRNSNLEINPNDMLT